MQNFDKYSTQATQILSIHITQAILTDKKANSFAASKKCKRNRKKTFCVLHLILNPKSFIFISFNSTSQRRNISKNQYRITVYMLYDYNFGAEVDKLKSSISQKSLYIVILTKIDLLLSNTFLPRNFPNCLA